MVYEWWILFHSLLVLRVALRLLAKKCFHQLTFFPKNNFFPVLFLKWSINYINRPAQRTVPEIFSLMSLSIIIMACQFRIMTENKKSHFKQKFYLEKMLPNIYSHSCKLSERHITNKSCQSPSSSWFCPTFYIPK